MKKINLLFILLLIGMKLSARTADIPLEKILQKEAKRNLDKLSTQETPAYYISYRVYETTQGSGGSTFGEQRNSNKSKNRLMHAVVRVGTPNLDNTHEIRSKEDNWDFSEAGIVELPLTNDEATLALIIWDYTDKVYKESVKRFQKVKANVAVVVAAEDKSPDFSTEKSEVYSEPVLPDQTFDQETEWLTQRTKRYSAIFKENKELNTGDVSFQITMVRSYFADTEETMVSQNSLQYRLSLSASTVADDGMNLPLYKSYYSHTLKEFPDDQTVEKDLKELSSLLSALRQAPVADTYAGPALLSPEASGVFFHEFFGHRIEGARMKQEADAQTFKKKTGELVLAEDMSVFFDPSINFYQKIPLSGSYVFDDEGIRGKRVDIVEKGRLKTFLMSRTPIEGILQSNGHGRGMIYYTPVTRQSNMIIESSSPKSEQEIRTLLKAELTRLDKPYGYLFSKVSGGFTNTNRVNANSFNVNPLVVYRIYADGRPDELVRGVNMIGTPLSMFSQIGACGKEVDVFNGYCGAESGSIPVSCIAPAIYVKMVETQRQSKSFAQPPILPRP